MITAKQCTIREILGDKFLHIIPPYQRPYAWTKQEAQQLLEDIVQSVERDNGEPYFLGSIILIRPGDQISGDVVDGQQRLVTLTILCAVLRDAATDPKEQSALAEAVYVEPDRYKAQTESIRVRMHKEDQAFFYDVIQLPGGTVSGYPSDPPKTDAQKLIWENAPELRTRVLKLELSRRQDLVTFLLNRCVVVTVSTSSRANALRIFRIINDRGLDLSNADVVKADLLDRLDESDIASYAAKWREFEIDLGRDDFEILLECIRFIRERGKNRHTLSEAYQERFRSASPTIVKTFFKEELTPAKFRLTEIIGGDAHFFDLEAREEVIETLAGLRLVPNNDWMPLALAIVMRLGGTMIAARALARVEGLAWAMQLNKWYDTQRMSLYAKAIESLDQGPESLISSLRLDDRQRRAANETLNGPLYDVFPVRVVRAILERLDRLLAEQPVLWNGQKTVEHILPQQPSPGTWLEFSEVQQLATTHLIGNLVLLSRRKNSEASNLPYKEKRSVYFGLSADSTARKLPTYASVQELAHVPLWTPEAFIARHRRHVLLLSKRWFLGDA